jgi:membrane dipeptidase
MLRLAVGALLLLAAAPLAARTPEEVAAAALRAAPVWDGHNDVAQQLRGRRDNLLAEFDFADTALEPGARGGEPSPMDTDLPRLRQGQVGAQFWSVFVSSDQSEADAVRQTLEQIDTVKRLVARYPGDLAMAYSAADVAQAMRAGRIASLMGIEGGHAIGGSLAVLRQMYALGVRYMTLTHYRNTAWADSADDMPAHDGLTEFGRDVVREMNRLGMVVDLAHVSAATMRDTLEVARAPVIFSHSNARAVVDESRNVPDDVLLRLKANGGIVMVTGVADFVSEGRRHWLAEHAAAQARIAWLWQGDPAKVKAEMAAWLVANPEVPVTVAELADHIDHIRRVAGIEHIGIGGDYDGWPTFPVGMDDVSGYPALFTELARRGYTQHELEQIASRNMMRVMRAVEAQAAAQRGEPPWENPAR